jgi:cold shock CspA family protein
MATTRTQRTIPTTVNGARLQGAIKTVKHGFCFIVGDDGVDRFAHRSDFQDADLEDLSEDTRVEFTHSEAVKGPRAIKIAVVQ